MWRTKGGDNWNWEVYGSLFYQDYQDSAEGFTRAYGVFRETEFLTVADLSLCLCCYCSPSMTGYFRSHRFVSRLIFPSLGYRSVPCSSRTAVPKALFLGIPGICI